MQPTTAASTSGSYKSISALRELYKRSLSPHASGQRAAGGDGAAEGGEASLPERTRTPSLVAARGRSGMVPAERRAGVAQASVVRETVFGSVRAYDDEDVLDRGAMSDGDMLRSEAPYSRRPVDDDARSVRSVASKRSTWFGLRGAAADVAQVADESTLAAGEQPASLDAIPEIKPVEAAGVDDALRSPKAPADFAERRKSDPGAESSGWWWPLSTVARGAGAVSRYAVISAIRVLREESFVHPDRLLQSSEQVAASEAATATAQAPAPTSLDATATPEAESSSSWWPLRRNRTNTISNPLNAQEEALKASESRANPAALSDAKESRPPSPTTPTYSASYLSFIWRWWYSSQQAYVGGDILAGVKTDAGPGSQMVSQLSYWNYFFGGASQQLLISAEPYNRSQVADSVIVDDTGKESDVSILPRAQPSQTPMAYSHKVLPVFEPSIATRVAFAKAHGSHTFGRTLTNVGSYLLHAPASLASTISGARSTTYRPKRMVIIGVHGWFPHKFVQRIVGEPTGTSEKFCELAEQAVRDYMATAADGAASDLSLTTIPLRGEGRITDRVDRLLHGIIDHEDRVQAIKSADCVFIVTHSQGVPVSTILLSQLCSPGGLIDPKRQRLGMLAMAGISHGPFPHLKGNVVVKYFEADAARELFEFMNSASDASRLYRDAIRTVLSAGGRITCVASMVDQVVPLYSAVMHGFTHPNILRAVYIDGHDFRDDFLTHFIHFLLRLRNHGVSDNGLAVHLSETIAGSLYTGTQGHSTIYEHVGVYTLAFRWLLESGTTSSYYAPHPTTPEFADFDAEARLNPYYLPWTLRGILEDERLNEDEQLLAEVEQLRGEFNEWEPSTRLMRELKFRLEPLKARL